MHLDLVQGEQWWFVAADLGWAAGGETKTLNSVLHSHREEPHEKRQPQSMGRLGKQERAEKDAHGQTGNSPSQPMSTRLASRSHTLRHSLHKVLGLKSHLPGSLSGDITVARA